MAITSKIGINNIQFEFKKIFLHEYISIFMEDQWAECPTHRVKRPFWSLSTFYVLGEFYRSKL